MTHLGVPITDGQCVDWQASEYDVIDCTPPNAGYYIGQCYHWTVEVCGANTISLELIYRDGRVKVFEVPISANKCPDATGTYNH